MSLSDSHLIKQNFQELQSRLLDYQHIYTDGSKGEDKVGCACVSGSHYEKFRLPDGLSIFTAESKAIDMALDYVRNNSLDNKFVIFYLSVFEISKSHNFKKLKFRTGPKNIMSYWKLRNFCSVGSPAMLT